MNGPSIYTVWKPRADLQLIANYRYLHSTYDKAMTYFPDPREDKQSTVGLTALWDISRFTGHDMAVRVQYIYVNNHSNVGTTDYDRQLVMTGLPIGFSKRLSTDYPARGCHRDPAKQKQKRLGRG